MKKILKILLIPLILFSLLNALVYFAEMGGEAIAKEKLDPSTPIYSIKGDAPESILLTPNKEHPFRSTNFISPIAGFGLELISGNTGKIVPTRDHVPIYFDKSNQSYVWFYLAAEKRIPKFVENGVIIPTTEFLDGHDFIIHSDKSYTLMEYIPDIPSQSVHLVLKRIDKKGRTSWTWNSSQYISNIHGLQFKESQNQYPEKLSLKEKLLRARYQYSQLAYNLVGNKIYSKICNIDLPLYFNRSITLFDTSIVTKDHIHANSIEYLYDEKYILVSARNLDTIFIIEVKSGNIIWSLGGPYSTFTKNRPIGDPRGGFSHQHDARVYKNKLYLYDNANLQSELPSRAVVYTFDFKNPNNCRFLYESLEPYGKRRLSMGSIQPLDPDRILIGWGGVPLGPDRDNTSAAASIVNMRTKKTEWQLDFKPGWTSYRARAYQQ